MVATHTISKATLETCSSTNLHAIRQKPAKAKISENLLKFCNTRETRSLCHRSVHLTLYSFSFNKDIRLKAVNSCGCLIAPKSPNFRSFFSVYLVETSVLVRRLSLVLVLPASTTCQGTARLRWIWDLQLIDCLVD